MRQSVGGRRQNKIGTLADSATLLAAGQADMEENKRHSPSLSVCMAVKWQG
jgi:hypothetical protein